MKNRQLASTSLAICGFLVQSCEKSIQATNEPMQKQPLRYFADTLEPIRRDDPRKIFYLRIEARPEADIAEAEQVAGGYANVWVDADDFRSAEIEAVGALQAEGWRPHRVDDWALRSRDDCSDEGLEFFDEAAAQGISFTIYTWDHDEVEENGTEQAVDGNPH
jgi:hypothetical protein